MIIITINRHNRVAILTLKNSKLYGAPMLKPCISEVKKNIHID